MKTLVAAFITALLVFTLATAWIEVVQPRLDMLALATSSKANEASTKSPTKRSPRGVANRDIDEDDDEFADEPARRVSTKSSRVAKAQKADAATKDRLLAQLEQVKHQESKLAERQTMMELLYQDIRRELAEVEAIRRRSAAELAIAERKVFETVAAKTSVASQANDAINEQRPIAKAKVAAEVSIASAIQELASRGNVQDAAMLLSGMKDREVAKVLMSLSSRDPSLALRLSDQVHAAKQGTVRQ